MDVMDRMGGMDWGSMGWGRALIIFVVVLALILATAALVKYLFPRTR